MPCTSADQVAINDAGLVHEGGSADFQVELAFGHGRHPTTPYHVRPGRNLHTVADTRDRLALFEEVACDTDQIRIVSDVLRCPSTRKKCQYIVQGTHL